MSSMDFTPSVLSSDIPTQKKANDDERPQSRALSYRVTQFQLNRERQKQLAQLVPRRAMLATALIWGVLFGLMLAGPRLVELQFGLWFYVPIAFLIAGRQGALIQVIHEASHFLLTSNRKWNSFWGNWFAAYPISFTVESYRDRHLQHHAHTGLELDPIEDREKYAVTGWRGNELPYFLFRDLIGLTALILFFRPFFKREKDAIGGKSLGDWAKIAAVQLFFIFVVFQGNLALYILFWLYPLLGPHMFLMRIRGIAEHGFSTQYGLSVQTSNEGTYYTRSMMTLQKRYGFQPANWVERALIGSLNINYHHEHHLLPTVPFYNLPLLHLELGHKIAEENPDIFVSGYFASLFTRPLKTSGQ